MKENLRERMQERWLRFWFRIGAIGDPMAAFEEIAQCYGESHRAYHTLEHIEQCLEELETIRWALTYPDAVELAIWFHDIVYVTNPRFLATENERYSASKADNFMYRLVRWNTIRRKKVFDYIVATRTHALALDDDCAYFLDIDMSILGQPDAEFDAYEAGIRFEHQHVPWDIFAEIRGKFVREWLQRAEENKLFFTEFFGNKFNEQAKKNLEWSLVKPVDQTA